MHELESWDSGSFITLTYNDENIPSNDGNLTLRKDHLQKFFKRLRRDLEYDKRNIKYFACGEYGEKLKRPHYHAIVFGIDQLKDLELVKENWPFGFSYTGSVTYDSIRYVADYVLKSGPVGVNEYLNKEKPFRLFSKGLGLEYINKNAIELEEKLGYTVRGISNKLPRYYKDKLLLDSSFFVEGALKQAEKEDRKYLEKTAEYKHSDMLKRGQQRENNILAKISLHERDYHED